MEQYADVVLAVTSPGGLVRAPSTASVQVNVSGGSAATIYSDDGVTPKTNPIVTDASGEYSFYAADGLYDLIISVPYGFTPETKTVRLFDNAGSSAAASINFTPSGTGAVTTTVQAKLRQIVSAFDFMTAAEIAAVQARTGTTDVSTNWQKGSDHAGTIGAIYYSPPGLYYLGTTQVTLSNQVIYVGAGQDFSASGQEGTYFKSDCANDAFLLNNAVDSFTPANVGLRDLTIFCNTRTAGKAAFAALSSSYVNLYNVGVGGNDYGIIFDQVQIGSIVQCDVELTHASSTAGVWLVNGAERTVGADAFCTNRINIERTQFNGNTAGVAIADDGGVSHAFRSNNFNGCDKHIRVNAASALVIDGANEMETPATTCIEFATTKLGGAAGAKSYNVKIDTNYLYSAAAINLITVGASSVEDLVQTNNHFYNDNASGNPTTGLSNVTTLYGHSNLQISTGGATNLLLGNNYNNASSYTGTLTGVDGSVTGTVKYIQNGKEVTVDVPRYDATSNATTKTITGMPSDIRPGDTKRFTFLAVDNGGAFHVATATLGADGVLTYYADDAFTAWTNSGAMTILDHSITYRLTA